MSDRLPLPHTSKHIIRDRGMLLQEGREVILIKITRAHELKKIKMYTDKSFIISTAKFHKKQESSIFDFMVTLII